MMKDGTPAYSNFDIAAYLAEAGPLGCVALRVGPGRRHGMGRPWACARPTSPKRPPSTLSAGTARVGRLDSLPSWLNPTTPPSHLPASPAELLRRGCACAGRKARRWKPPKLFVAVLQQQPDCFEAHCRLGTALRQCTGWMRRSSAWRPPSACARPIRDCVCCWAPSISRA